jgi:hypothetical protein
MDHSHEKMWLHHPQSQGLDSASKEEGTSEEGTSIQTIRSVG